MPRSRTGLRSGKTLATRSRPTSANSPLLAMVSGRVRLRVIYSKSAYFTLTVTVRPQTPDRSRPPPPSAGPYPPAPDVVHQRAERRLKLMLLVQIPGERRLGTC